MTERLYYDDAYTTEFSARVVERLEVDERPGVILDRTYFYPTGGGQPHDTGTIGGVEVLDVYPREGDHAVVHLLTGRVGGEEVSCRLDWTRRFDHMQHHTGQHILTQSFVEVAAAETVGFHLGVDSVTIDLDVSEVSPPALEQAEELANQIVFENRPVAARLLVPGEEGRVRIRKEPDYLATDGLRIVEVADFDWTACGGTHVSHTGQIGLIKIVRLDRRGDKTRVEFRCGGRALRDYRVKNALANQLAADFTVGYWEVEGAVARLKAELRDTRRTLKEIRAQYLNQEAAALLESATKREGLRLVTSVFEGRDVAEVRELASRLVAGPDVVVLLGVSGQQAQLIVARSANLPYDLRPVLTGALAVLGSQRGGGRPEFAQGGGVAADAEQLQAALREAEAALLGAG